MVRFPIQRPSPGVGNADAVFNIPLLCGAHDSHIPSVLQNMRGALQSHFVQPGTQDGWTQSTNAVQKNRHPHAVLV